MLDNYRLTSQVNSPGLNQSWGISEHLLTVVELALDSLRRGLLVRNLEALMGGINYETHLMGLASRISFSTSAGREIFHVASGTYSRLVPQTPEKIAGQSLQ